VGGSNMAWQTWPDQLHMYLRELGYVLPAVQYSQPNINFATDRALTCDDESDFSALQTPRVAHAGWASWDFAYDSDDDCSAAPNSFRTIAGHTVSCVTGWACNPESPSATEKVRPATVAQDARSANVVLLSNWVNDFKQQWSDYTCFNGEALDPMSIADITVDSLRRIIHEVHEVNPTALVLVMAMYPDATGAFVKADTLSQIEAINAKVARGVSGPGTAFVDFDVPQGVEMFQTAHPGHLNCRGDRLMAHSVLKALYERRVIANSLAPLPAGEVATCQVESNCAGITDQACCQAAASCRVARSGKCVPYGPGVGR